MAQYGNPLLLGNTEKQKPAEAPQGGLLPRAVGGLSSFAANVDKGINLVLSHPLYANLWAGAVSGMTGDPGAGPFAVSQLKRMAMDREQQSQDIQITRAARDNDELSRIQMKRLADAVKREDPRNATAAFADLDPVSAYGMMMEPPPTPKAPTPKAVFGPDRKPIYVDAADAIGKEPYFREGITINTGSVMRPDQEYSAEDRAKSATLSETAKLRDALDAHAALTALVFKIRSEKRAPNASETDSIVKMAARLENPEMVGEGDMARKAGGGAANYFRSLLNQPFQLDGRQFDSIVGTADVIANQKRLRLEEITRAAQGVAEERGLNPEAVTPILTGAPPEQPPAGAKPHSTIPNVYVLPNGEWWAP